MGGYREAAAQPERTTTTLTYGPFHERSWRHLAVVPTVLAFWILFGYVAGGTVQLSCVDADCSVETAHVWLFGVDRTVFSADTISSRDVHTNRNGTRVRLYDQQNLVAEFELGGIFGGSTYEDFAAHLDNPRGELSTSTSPSWVFWFMLTIGTVLMVGLVYGVLSIPFRVELQVSEGAIEIAECWPWYARRRRFELGHPSEVRVLEQRIDVRLLGGVDGALIQVVDVDRSVRALADPYPNVDSVWNAARQLSEALEIDFRQRHSTGDESE